MRAQGPSLPPCPSERLSPPSPILTYRLVGVNTGWDEGGAGVRNRKDLATVKQNTETLRLVHTLPCPPHHGTKKNLTVLACLAPLSLPFCKTAFASGLLIHKAKNQSRKGRFLPQILFSMSLYAPPWNLSYSSACLHPRDLFLKSPETLFSTVTASLPQILTPLTHSLPHPN